MAGLCWRKTPPAKKFDREVLAALKANSISLLEEKKLVSLKLPEVFVENPIIDKFEFIRAWSWLIGKPD